MGNKLTNCYFKMISRKLLSPEKVGRDPRVDGINAESRVQPLHCGLADHSKVCRYFVKWWESSR